MLFGSEYKTISNFPEATITEQGSRFLAYAFCVSNEKELKDNIEKIKLKFPDATHHCFACILHPDKSFIKINDDGEPSNTAGRPILIQINKLDITNILLVVVRYYGGKKLGIPGLISAYGNAASKCLENAEVIVKKLYDYYKLFSIPEKDFEIYNIVKKHKAKIIKIATNNKTEIEIAIDRESTDKFLKECHFLPNFEVKYIKTE
ncbi:MAG: YigZ family protein [Bacteroidetes bacterium]|nr:YigZ family protein [Bacteroidota bacterium]